MTRSKIVINILLLHKNISFLIKIGEIEIPDFPLLLAPMEDVSDPPFRALCKEQGADVVYTEFISSEGLIRNAHKSVIKLDIFEKENQVEVEIAQGIKINLLKAHVSEVVNPQVVKTETEKKKKR